MNKRNYDSFYSQFNPFFIVTMKRALLLVVFLFSTSSQAEIISDVSNTKHNFSASTVPGLPGNEERSMKATSESQVCVFCHTPHGASDLPKAPLWNRSLSTSSYIPYSSSSLDATDLGQPEGKSKLCLSCHDGTIAVGSVNVLNRKENPTISFSGAESDGSIDESDQGSSSGYTRRLGVDLSNDHPISFTFDSALSLRDGELRSPNEPGESVAERSPGNHAKLPLEDGQLECISCHDPHVTDDASEVSIKFLRLNRFQQVPPTEGAFNERGDIICLGCHKKDGWVNSAHANPLVADELYERSAAELREFPQDMPVWQGACVNCHDPHAVEGSRRILREGTDGQEQIAFNGAKYKQGGGPAIEETCYMCHSKDGGVLQGQGSTGFQVPDVKTDFTTMLRRMPIATIDQPAGVEVHSIGTGNGTQLGKDFVESRELLGHGDLSNRHAECTDCHNPHRVMKKRKFNDDGAIPDEGGTHIAPTNIASGVLRGVFGVEPKYGSTAFGSLATSYDEKRGDGGVGASEAVESTYLTREYQLCFKCHSNYAYDTPPMLGGRYRGGTPPGTNAMEQYTDQAMEFQSPDGHKGGGTSLTSTGSHPDYAENNHRSWHPVVNNTGRTPEVRKADKDNWLPPFNQSVGNQNMYCTDCHGSDTPPGSIEPMGGENGFAWGPHGSNNNFILKGAWDDRTGGDGANGGTPNALCFKCHDYNDYGKFVDLSSGEMSGESGFQLQSPSITGSQCIDFAFQNKNLHSGHVQALTGVTNFRCSLCHVAVPHGWKNKTFLANLNDVGPEAGLAPGTQVRNNKEDRYYQGPYYNGAVLKVKNFARSGEWLPENCGSVGVPGNSESGLNWMTGQKGSPNQVSDPNSEGCNAIP